MDRQCAEGPAARHSPWPRTRLRAWGVWAWGAGAAAYAGYSLAPAPMVFLDTRLTSSITLDKAVHFLFFLFLAAMAVTLFESLFHTVLAILAVLALALGTEFLQLANPVRTYSSLDMLANVAGFLAGGVAGLAARLLCCPAET